MKKATRNKETKAFQKRSDAHSGEQPRRLEKPPKTILEQPIGSSYPMPAGRGNKVRSRSEQCCYESEAKKVKRSVAANGYLCPDQDS